MDDDKRKNNPGIVSDGVSHFFQMIQRYLLLLQQLLRKPEQLRHFQWLYWQELSLLWQRFMLAKEKEDIQKANSIFGFTQEFYRLHIRHMHDLLKIAEKLDAKAIQDFQCYLKRISCTLPAENREDW
jgi:hypothetical protein